MRRAIPAEIIAQLPAAGTGLTAVAAAAVLARLGPNDIVTTTSRGWRDLVANTATDPMLWFLLCTSMLFAAVGDVGGAVILLVALIPLLGMDAYLHRRTQASTESLSDRLANVARVLRDGEYRSIAATQLVPGDLVEVRAGESFPADGVLIGGHDMQVDESALTGEAYPVAKQPLAMLPTAPNQLIDALHWAWAGSRLLTGGGAQLRLTHTGSATIYGEIVRSARQIGATRTPLQNAINQLVRLLLAVTVVICVVLAWVRVQQGYGIIDGLISAVTLAIAALPEEFPIVFTFFLGVGVYRLAHQHALVRRAVVVENIGRVSTICSDKTGTLTEGRLRVAHLQPAAPCDETRLLEIATLASRADSGDPLDEAIFAAAPRVRQADVAAIFPFTEDRKRETIVVHADNTLLCATKGAPEIILALCCLDAAKRAHWLTQVDAFARSSHRVIACASRELVGALWNGSEPEHGFVFAGLLACEDPLRDGAARAVAICRNADIHVLMITGDHPLTATAIATELGLGGAAPNVISGAEMEAQLAGTSPPDLRTVDVIARAMPSQKLTVVRALQAAGEIVAVTGDGVNDVPALQAADIGIAMGERGTRSAREIAAIVLLDDNFGSVVRAIAEGRQLFANLQLSFEYLLMIHIPLVITAALIPLLGYPILYLPIHIVWLELIIHPTALLVFQNVADPGRLARRKKESKLRFFDPRQWSVIVLIGALITAAIVGTYLRSLGVGYAVEHARAMALVTLILASAAVTIGLSHLRTVAARIVVAATLLSAVVLVQTPLPAGWLHLAKLHVDDWLLALTSAALIGLVTALARRAH